MQDFYDFIIGGAQFGQCYGVTSERKEVSQTSLSNLLCQSWDFGISTIDTAPAYGNSEEVLGKKEFQKFEFISKSLISDQTCSGISNIESSLKKSLKKLNKASLSGYLVHNTRQFIEHKNSSDMWRRLCELRANGLIGAIGFSVYEEDEITITLNSFSGIDFFQVPINLFDQRLSDSDAILAAKSKNVAIHARSIFLQGLLLCDMENIPPSLAIIREGRKTLEMFNDKNGYTNLEVALAYIRSLNFISKIVVGLKSVEQLIQLKDADQKSEDMKDIKFEAFRIDDINSVDPRRWTQTCQKN